MWTTDTFSDNLVNFLCLQWPPLTFWAVCHPSQLVSHLCLIPKILLAIRADIITNFPNIFGPGFKFSAIGPRAGVSDEHWSWKNKEFYPEAYNRNFGDKHNSNNIIGINNHTFLGRLL